MYKYPYALTSSNEAIHVNDAIPFIDYFCPVCKAPVALKKDKPTRFNLDSEHCDHVSVKRAIAKFIIYNAFIRAKSQGLSYGCQLPDGYQERYLFNFTNHCDEIKIDYPYNNGIKPNILFYNESIPRIVIEIVIKGDGPFQHTLDIYKKDNINVLLLNLNSWDDYKNLNTTLGIVELGTLCCGQMILSDGGCKKCGLAFPFVKVIGADKKFKSTQPRNLRYI